MKLCAIDNGYYETKVKTEDRMYKFQSKIQKATDENNTISYEGETYTIGEGKDDLLNNKTQGYVHKLCTLRALAEQTEDEEDFNLILDLPLIHYYNDDFRDEFKALMSKTEVIRHNGKLKKINIKKCSIIPQGLAALYANNISEHKEKMVAVLDIGGLTIDGCIVENLKPIKESMFTINLGTKILENRIKTALNKKYLLNIQDYEIPYIMQDGIKGIDCNTVIQSVYEEYFETLTREMITKNWSVETLKMLGIGGGILRLQDTINFYYNNFKVSANPVFDNVTGIYNIGKVMK
jgi:hypothetical protein